MKAIDKNLYYKEFAQVSVNEMIMFHGAKCNKCNIDNQEFTVFVGNGQKMSTMFSCCCSKCLPLVVKDAIIDDRKTAEDQIKRAEERLYKESLELVRKIKLNNLGK